MDDLERRLTEMILRVGNFGAENAEAIRANQKAVAAFAVIQTAISRLEQLGALRASAGETKLAFSERRALLREEVYFDLTAIAKTARQIARDDAAFVNKFKVPRNNRNDAILLETARAFAADLVAVRQLFLDYGMPADFITELAADTDAFESAISE